MINFKLYHKFQTFTPDSYIDVLNIYYEKFTVIFRKYYFYRFFLNNNYSNYLWSPYNKIWFQVNSVWNVFCATNNLKYYYAFLKQIWILRPKFKKKFNNRLKHFLLFFQIKPTALFEYPAKQFTISFIRVQRRYNKRRYSKARVYSRSSFFGGCALSAVFVGNFWNGTHKGVDWEVTLPHIIDMNSLVLFMLIYLTIRLWQLNTLFFFQKSQHKIKIVENNKLNIILKNLQKYFV